MRAAVKGASLRSRGMLIGDVAKTLAVGIQTLYYYEREGLLPSPERSESGYRLYTADMMDRVRFIRKAQALGLALHEIKDILELAEQGTSPCGRVQESLVAKLREVDERLRELRRFRNELAALVEKTGSLSNGSGQARVCAIVEESRPPMRGDLGAPLLRLQRRRSPRSSEAAHRSVGRSSR